MRLQPFSSLNIVTSWLWQIILPFNPPEPSWHQNDAPALPGRPFLRWFCHGDHASSLWSALSQILTCTFLCGLGFLRRAPRCLRTLAAGWRRAHQQGRKGEQRRRERVPARPWQWVCSRNLLWMCTFASEGETCLRYCQEHAEIFLMNNELLIRTLNQLVRHGPKATQTHLT